MGKKKLQQKIRLLDPCTQRSSLTSYAPPCHDGTPYVPYAPRYDGTYAPYDAPSSYQIPLSTYVIITWTTLKSIQTPSIITLIETKTLIPQSSTQKTTLRRLIIRLITKKTLLIKLIRRKTLLIEPIRRKTLLIEQRVT